MKNVFLFSDDMNSEEENSVTDDDQLESRYSSSLEALDVHPLDAMPDNTGMSFAATKATLLRDTEVLNEKFPKPATKQNNPPGRQKKNNKNLKMLLEDQADSPNLPNDEHPYLEY